MCVYVCMCAVIRFFWISYQSTLISDSISSRTSPHREGGSEERRKEGKQTNSPDIMTKRLQPRLLLLPYTTVIVLHFEVSTPYHTGRDKKTRGALPLDRFDLSKLDYFEARKNVGTDCTSLKNKTSPREIFLRKSAL